jgi:hypothetical protein
MSDGEDAKAPKFNTAALCRCIFNIFDDSFDYPLHVGTVERGLRMAIKEISSDLFKALP